MSIPTELPPIGSSSYYYIIGDYVVPVTRQAYSKCDGGWDWSVTWVGIDGWDLVMFCRLEAKPMPTASWVRLRRNIPLGMSCSLMAGHVLRAFPLFPGTIFSSKSGVPLPPPVMLTS